MGKLSIRSLSSLKKLPSLGLLAVAPVIVQSQVASPNPVPIFFLSFKADEPTEKDCKIFETIDSLYQVMKPELLDFYKPQPRQTKALAEKCKETQLAISDVLILRKEIPYEGMCILNTIILHSRLTSPEDIAPVLQHELFHLARRDLIKQNLKAYNSLPLDEIKKKYFKICFTDYIALYKNLLPDFFHASIIYKTDFPECDTELEELKDEYIKTNAKMLDSLTVENYKAVSSESTLANMIDFDTHSYVDYIITPEEFYARWRSLQQYLQLTYGIERRQITSSDIESLWLDNGYSDCEFLKVINWFHEEFIQYIQELEPK